MPLKEGKARFNNKRRSSSKQARAKDSAGSKLHPAPSNLPVSQAGTPLKENDLSSKKIKRIQQLIYKDTQPFGLAASARDELERDHQIKSFR